MNNYILLSRLFLCDVQFLKVGEVFRHFSSVRTCYEVLGLSPSCTPEEIKGAYVKLCKQLHPDVKPGDKTQHKKFVELNNAYSTLINTQTRRTYDQNFRSQASGDNFSNQRHHGTYQNPFHSNAWKEETYWHHRHSTGNFYECPTDTYDNNKRTTKVCIVAGCFALMMIGTVLYLSAYSFAVNYTHKRIDAKSQRISAAYLKVKEESQENGRKELLKRYYERWGLQTDIFDDK